MVDDTWNCLCLHSQSLLHTCICHILWQWHCLEADDCVDTFEPWKGAVLGRWVVGRCCLAVIGLNTDEAIKVNSHLCAYGSGDVVHTWVRRHREVSTAAHHTVQWLVVLKWTLNGCSRDFRVHCWNKVHNWILRDHLHVNMHSKYCINWIIALFWTIKHWSAKFLTHGTFDEEPILIIRTPIYICMS